MKSKLYNCVVCDGEISLLDWGGDEEKEKDDWQGMWDGGIVEKIAAGYGSQLDGDMFVIAICDKCVVDKKLKYIGNYILGGWHSVG